MTESPKPSDGAGEGFDFDQVVALSAELVVEALEWMKARGEVSIEARPGGEWECRWDFKGVGVCCIRAQLDQAVADALCDVDQFGPFMVSLTARRTEVTDDGHAAAE